MKTTSFFIALTFFFSRFALADAPPSPTPDAKPDPAEEKAVEDLKAKEAARLATEIEKLRNESARQLEQQIAAARSKSENELNQTIKYVRARMTEERAGIISDSPFGGGTRVLRTVDRSLTTERSLLLLPEGCLVIEMHITVDGKPLQDESEEILDDMLATADANQDGKTTWEEALKSTDFRVGSRAYNNQQMVGDRLPQFLKQYDANEDGIVARAEARLFLAAASGGPAFSTMTAGGNEDGMAYLVVGGVATSQRVSAEKKSPLDALIDTDDDGIFNRRELVSASWRLKLRDKNDDDVIEFAELFDMQSPYFYGGGRRGTAPHPLVLHLGPTADWESIWKQLSDRYAKDGKITAARMPLSTEMLAALDKNANTTLDREELQQLNQAEPQITVEANIGSRAQTQGQPRAPKKSFFAALAERFTGSTTKPEPKPEPEKVPLKVTTRIPGITASGNLDAATQTFTISLPGVRLSIVPDQNSNNWRMNIKGQVENYMTRFDANKNGYLEGDELKQLEQQYGSSGGSWDSDGDGKVYPEEITSFFVRTQRPQFSRISLGAMEQPHALFYTLDENGDGKLGERESLSARERMMKLDTNRDGRLAAGEIPKSIRLAVGRTNYVNQLLQPQGRGRAQFFVASPNLNRNGGRGWFACMDVNSDGDVSRREFLGPVETFSLLDKNQDGFIDATEAKQAGTLTQQASK